MTQNYFVGVDGGGTKCKARLENEQGELLGEGLSGPCNPAQSAEIAFSSIIEATTLALEAAAIPTIKISDLNVCLGLAGLGDRTWGWPGHVIDILAVLATLFGLATSLGLGAQQAASGMDHVFGIDPVIRPEP